MRFGARRCCWMNGEGGALSRFSSQGEEKIRGNSQSRSGAPSGKNGR